MITARKPTEQITYKYKLNVNYKGEDSVCINGVNLVKGGWNDFDRNQNEKLKPYIRSNVNPTGYIDEHIHDPLIEFQVNAHNTSTKFVHKKKIYTRDVLVTFVRAQLEEIAREYMIETKEKVNPFLINCIMEEQQKYRQSLKEEKDFFDETNKIEKPEE